VRHRPGEHQLVSKPHSLLVVENAPVPHDRRVWNEARALVDLGYDVTVLSPANTKMRLTARREQREGVEIWRFPMPFGGPRKIDFVSEYGWAVLAVYWRAWRIWRQKRFDVIHVANPPDVFFGLKWLFGRRGVKFIFDVHDLGPEIYQSKYDEARVDFLARMLLWLERRTFRAADAVIVTNESYRQRAVSRGRMGDDAVFTVRNSPDLELFRSRPARPELKAGFDHMVVFVGTMGHEDGVHLLLDAADHVRRARQRPDVLFVLVGTGDSWEQLQGQHDTLGLGDGVRFTGFISDNDMLDYLATADIGAAPDLVSSFNDISTMIKTMDYMAMGLPVVSFDLTESRVSAGEAAHYAPACSAASFGDAIIELLDDPERRQKMSRLGRDRIEGPLSWAHSAEQLAAAYEWAQAAT
jgi:glycosyltransferase involved in cell wall biosynthesis